ncbi:MAG: PepSY-associated TM helix domain-containing protein [Methylococcales bacterium]
MDFHSPRRSIRAEYWVGNAFVSVKRQDGNLFEFMTRLHKGVGMGVGWVLLTDTLALGLVFLSVTGLLMWTRTQGSGTTLVGLGITSFLLALALILYGF